MTFFSYIYQTLLEALFPLTREERALLTIKRENLWQLFPRSPRSSIPESCSLFAYKDKRVSTLIWSLKYRKSKHAVEIGGYALHNILKTYAKTTKHTIIIPMPISKQRRRERGFNQCELLIDEIEKLDNADIAKLNTRNSESVLTITRTLLVRSHHNKRQTLKDRHERLEGVKKIFSINMYALKKMCTQLNIIDNKPEENSGLLENYLIIIVDDVITTGSTMKEAVYTLREAGLINTYGLALAH